MKIWKKAVLLIALIGCFVLNQCEELNAQAAYRSLSSPSSNARFIQDEEDGANEIISTPPPATQQPAAELPPLEYSEQVAPVYPGTDGTWYEKGSTLGDSNYMGEFQETYSSSQNCDAHPAPGYFEAQGYTDYSCGNNCHSVCRSGCGCNRRFGRRCRKRDGGTYFAGAEATFLYADYDGPNAMISLADGFGRSQTNAAVGEFGYLGPSPRVWVGHQKSWERNAFVVRYWSLGASENRSNLGDMNLQTGDWFTNSSLNMYTIDMEYSKYLGGTTRLLFGGRFADFEASAYANGSVFNGAIFILPGGFVPSDSLSANALAQNHFMGAGPLLGLTGSRNLRRGLKFYWAARGSALIGENYTRAYTVANSTNGSIAASGVVSGGFQQQNVSRQGFVGADFQLATQGEDDSIAWVGELQCGISYTHQVTCKAEFFVRAGMEYQYWGILGGDVQSMVSRNNNSVVASARTDNIDLHLYGLTCSAGFSF